MKDEVIKQSENHRVREVGNDWSHFGHTIFVEETKDENGNWEILGPYGRSSPFGYYIDYSGGYPVVKENDPTR